ncbi:hypothetical protein L202_03739 [Cryptococcus amylolentus CBS 6039]|uniref:Ras-GEF domain-containing protein n=2 Tax=Cryptococcus amylolentus TaxID=104669 RepID=A0A1E3HUM6_9TREE|nr:hypothetical protein L202_03739 [Cryptococcus amylolentus CBS 6039]ODN79845.1 hypothetical protein L202_03739 [Cryptococcus amylolentus CBS 6039]
MPTNYLLVFPSIHAAYRKSTVTMHRPNAQHLTLDHLAPPTPSDFASPATPSPTTPASFHTPLAGTPSTLRLAMSEEEARRSSYKHRSPSSSPIMSAYAHHVPDLAADPSQAALLQSARMKLSSQDQEAMSKLRVSMKAQSVSDSNSSSSLSPSSPRFPPGTGGQPTRTLRTRRSTLSKIAHTAELEDVKEGKGESEDDGQMKRGQSQPALSRTEPQVPPASSADHVIAVVGHEGVGKTTVIARALRTWGMSNPVKIQSVKGHLVSSCYSQIAPGGKLESSCIVEFLEMDIRTLDLDPDAPTIWPASVPGVSGVICCYDAMREETLEGLKDCVARFASINIPTVLLACKSDPHEPLKVLAARGNTVGEPFNVGLIEVTEKTQEGKAKMRNALRWLLYKLEQRQRRQLRQLAALDIPQALSTDSTLPSSADASSSATAAEPSSLDHLPSPDSDGESHADKLMWKKKLSLTPRNSEEITRASGVYDQEEGDEGEVEMLEDEPEPAQEGGGKGASQESLGWLARPEEGPDAGKKAVGEKLARADSTVSQGTQGELPVYMSLEDIYNHLFTSIVTSKDDEFVKAFFMTYRRFCQPSEVMKEFLVRFQEVEEYGVSRDVRNWALMKLAGALVDWTTRYTGDICEPITADIFSEIVSLLLKHTFMAHLLSDLVTAQNLLPQRTDVDQSWSLKPESDPPHSATSELVIDSEILYDLEKFDDGQGSDSFGRMTGSTNSVSTSSLALDSQRRRSGSEPRPTTNLVHPPPPPLPQQKTEKEGSVSSGKSRSASGSHKKLDVIPHLNDEVSEARWGYAINSVLRMDPRTFAAELTRLQWELFENLRPRDVFRHDFGKETDGPVGKAIAFFNRLSRWISTMILAPHKPKHRARLIERFMIIAHQLRRLNNYDSLCAVISGLRETSVHRLASTNALVQLSPAEEKEFQSHLKLMDPRGGYVHYRRALQADISHGRGAIPLINNILSLVIRLQSVRHEDVRKSDGMVQWDKFMRFGEILGTITDCQNRGPAVQGEASPGFRKLMEETVILTDEDALWERSQMLENGTETMGGKMLKRLANFGFS